jgi:hypothetical protein
MTRSMLLILPFCLLACSGKDGGDSGSSTGGGTEDGDDGTTPDCDLATDADCDGVLDGDDCEPDNPLAYPGAAEIPYDGVDNDCAGDGDLTDVDGDGHEDPRVGGDDCNDGNADAYPGAPELCYDGIDQDCDGFPTSLDDETNDCDGDGHEGRGTEATDCDDTDPAINPDADEVWYNGVDENCDTNDGDQDLDGYDAVEVGGEDCDDTDPLVYGGTDAVERLNGADADCDGTVDNPSQLDANLSYYGSVATKYFWFGMSVLPVWDVDSDGVDDFLVGAPLSGSTEVCFAEGAITPCEGRGLLIPGGVEAASGAPDNSAIHEVAGFAGTSGAGSWLGWDMANVGDIDNDGTDDIAFGAPQHGGQGAVIIYSGADIEATTMGAPLYPNNAIARLTASLAGFQVSALGDLDGDGIQEIAAGSGVRLNDPTIGEIAVNTWVGVWDGGTVRATGGEMLASTAELTVDDSGIGGEVLGGHDLDGDGVADLLVGSGTYTGEDGKVGFIDGTAIHGGGSTALSDHTLVTGDTGAELGLQLAVLSDLDGDGYDEVAISAHNADGNAVIEGTGEVYLLDGDDVAAGGVASSLAHTTIYGEADYDGLTVGGESGFDLDGDGIDELMVVRMGYPGQLVRGAAYVFNGTTLQAGGVHNAQDASIFLESRSEGDWWGISAAGWDMDSDGDDDLLIGGPNGSSSSGMAAVFQSYFAD